jgi:hypothetical protein
MLRTVATGFGSTALAWILHQERLSAAPSDGPRAYGLRPKKPDFTPKIKSVIYLYIGGGPGTVDMLDAKPVLAKVRRPGCAYASGRTAPGRLPKDDGKSVAI